MNEDLNLILTVATAIKQYTGDRTVGIFRDVNSLVETIIVSERNGLTYTVTVSEFGGLLP